MSLEQVQVVWNVVHPDGSDEKNVGFLELLCLKLADTAGLLAKPAGENIAPYKGTLVSKSRICYPNGQLYKVLTDAGPGGANGPGWADDGVVDASRYVKVEPQDAQEGGLQPPGATIPSAVDLAPLEAEIGALKAANAVLEASLKTLAENVATHLNELYTAAQAHNRRFEALEAKRSINTSRVFGHSHKVEV